MGKKVLLHFGILVCIIAKILFLVGIIGYTVGFVYVQQRPDIAERITFSPFDRNGLNMEIHASAEDAAFTKSISNKMMIDFKDVSTLSLYLIYFQWTAILLLSFLCVRGIYKVLISIKNKDVFNKKNVRIFKRIGLYLLFIFLLSSYWSISTKSAATFDKINPAFIPLFLMIGAFILSGVIKNGQTLQEENELTV